MSYTRSFQKTVKIHYSGTISYPPSEHGGTKSYSGTATETVYVNVEVDTNPFEDSIENCNDHVKALTGTVAATETAQVKSIRDNARRVGDTIIDGFFKSVRSEISSQIMELSQRVESHLMHLRQQAQMLRKKREDMENNYHRTSARYTRIFEDLNRELDNRVKALDEPVFKSARLMKEESDRMLNGDFVDVASVTASEGGLLNAQIASALTKKRAETAIGSARQFLVVQKQTDAAISQSVIGRQLQPSYYLPVCFAEKMQQGGTRELVINYDQQKLSPAVRDSVNGLVYAPGADSFDVTPEHIEHISNFFSEEVQGCYAGATDEHSTRVMNTINRLFKS